MDVKRCLKHAFFAFKIYTIFVVIVVSKVF